MAYEKKITVIYLPENISLGAALVAALNLMEGDIHEPLHVLLGDTLIPELPQGQDIIAISEVEDSYNWAVVSSKNTKNSKWLDVNLLSIVDSNNIVCGYFVFSQAKHLVKAIIKSHWDFIEGINRYRIEIGLTAIRITNWLDFGHLNTFYRSKMKCTTQRSFNNLNITNPLC